MIGMDLYRVLSSNTAITDIVGDRIYPCNARETELKDGCIVYRIGSPTIPDTYEEGSISLANISFTVSCIANSYSKSQALYKTVFAYLTDYSDDYFEGIKYENNVNEDSYIDPELDTISWYEAEITFRAWFHWKTIDEELS